ncbi:MAG: methyl-accepting chemotaxis protein [Chloroflexi bacterium]|uniref:Methyl-accepting chemotaxis protein n=1 Tax=Candidatus Chlorohelix allophototropha TaxID=3003348 RepID=A0A8T7M224_9CHLR|nr:methyl-accepting chemotaxis protein [Chloroflexota bacterium]WJW66171.1 methyl-accepting chemotaxis protein [Chloroflexota bacterium L227-S17]
MANKRISIFSLHSLSGRIYFTLFFIIVLVTVNGLASFYLLGHITTTRDLEEQSRERVNYAKDLEYLLDEQTEFYQLYADNFNSNLQQETLKQDLRVEEQFREITPAFSDPKINSGFQKIVQNYQAVAQIYNMLQNLNLKPENAKQLFFDSQANRRKLFDELKSYTAELTKIYVGFEQEGRDNVSLTLWIAGLALIGSITLVLLLTFSIPRLLSRPLSALNDKLKLTAEGDLTPKFLVKGAQEIMELSENLNKALARLRIVITRIQLQANTVSITSHHLEEASTRQASSLSEQAVAVSQVSTTVNELSGTSQQIAESASMVAQSANESLNSAEIGYNTMHALSQKMADITQRVNLIADRIIALNSVSQRIREATSLISTLSDDTHLLALNAAIESAGAGEEGERFSVVASQVRKLSQRSRQAAVEIQQLISQIQQATTASVMATEDGIKVVALGRQMVEEALEANKEIIEAAKHTSQLSYAISLATDQQRVANTQVAGTMQQMSHMIANISEGSKSYLSSSNALIEIARQLNTLIGTIKLRDDLKIKKPGATPTFKMKRVKTKKNLAESKNGTPSQQVSGVTTETTVGRE